MARAPELGLGAAEVLSVPGTGTVVGVYSKAAYLRLPGGLVALTTFDVPSGPIHLRCSEPLGRLRPGDRAVVAGTVLQAGPLLLALGGAQVWEGRLPAGDLAGAGERFAADLAAAAAGSSLDPALARRAAGLLGDGDLAGAGGCLGGAGPGLTPAGDDCLAGILLISKVRGRPAEDIASGVETNQVARAFLHWAARGQSIEPVHRFLVSAEEADIGGAADALKELTNFGHSSGADLALGLKLGLELIG